MRARTLLLATFVAAGTTLVFGVSAHAQNRDGYRDRDVSSYCSRHPRDPDCRAHRRGDNSSVGRILRKTGNVITGAGRVVGSAIGAGVCDARHKNYDQSTNTYRGQDGRRHRC